jgi:chromosome segregation ATPase
MFVYIKSCCCLLFIFSKLIAPFIFSAYTKIPVQFGIASKVVEELQRKMKSLEDQVDSLRSASSQAPKTDLSDKVSGLENQVMNLNNDLNCQGSKIDDLAIACVEACKDRVGIKQAVANLLMVISNELGGKE